MSSCVQFSLRNIKYFECFLHTQQNAKRYHMLCFFLKCVCNTQFVWKFLSHRWHWKCLTLKWMVSMCRLQLADSVNSLLQILHWALPLKGDTSYNVFNSFNPEIDLVFSVTSNLTASFFKSFQQKYFSVFFASAWCYTLYYTDTRTKAFNFLSNWAL